MSKTQAIWKYHIRNVREILEMPIGALILSFQLQTDTPTIWVLLNPQEKRTEAREFHLKNTGPSFMLHSDELYLFIGTVQYSNGIVQHLFERVETENQEEYIPF